MESHPRLEKNAPGAFYTTGQCLACGAPEAEAPMLLAPLAADNWDTYFIRQPKTPEEVESACRAALVCCTDALRYGGTDSAIIRRLGNRPEHSDHVLPGGPIRYPGENDRSWQRTMRNRRRWWQFWLR
jgi:hypothetical protein